MISIVIPVHNGEKYIDRAIKSVINQRGNWELIVVNDHSVDSTERILNSHSSNNERVHVINSESYGVTNARMTGAKEASGDYLFFMDIDDEIPKDTIISMCEALEENPNLDIIISDIIDVLDSNNIKNRSYGNHCFSRGIQLFEWIVDNHTGYLWGKAINKNLFLSLDFVPSKLKFCEDYIQMLQLSIKAQRIKHIGKAGYIYYQIPDSACNKLKTRNIFAKQFYDLASALKDLTKIRSFNSKNYNGTISPGQRVRVMFLYYTRLYLAVSGKWGKDENHLREAYKLWMKDVSLELDKLYDRRRRIQTKFAYYVPILMAIVYVPLLRYKYHRIK